MVRFPATVITRTILVAACGVNLTAADLTQLRQLEEKHRIFELRDLLDAPGGNTAGTLFYRALTNSRFGREREAVSQFRGFLATNPGPEVEAKARYELSHALARLGEIGGAASEMAAALRLTPESAPGRADGENARAFLECLKGVAAQTVEFGVPARIQGRRNELGLWVVPVDINSQHSEWILDTGASISTVSESEARRLGLAMRELHAYGIGFTGTKNPARLGVAGEVRLGYARLRNVAVMVVSDGSCGYHRWGLQFQGSWACLSCVLSGAWISPRQANSRSIAARSHRRAHQISSWTDLPRWCRFVTSATTYRCCSIPGTARPFFIRRFAMF